MDKNGKLFGKISILDIFIVLLLVGVLAGTMYKYRSTRTEMFSASETIQYTTRISSVREFSLENYYVGLECFDTMTNEFIGTIVDVRSEPVYEVIENLFGELVLVQRPDIIDIYLDIEATGLETDRAYLINGTYELKVGSELRLTTRHVNVFSNVDSIRTGNDIM